MLNKMTIRNKLIIAFAILIMLMGGIFAISYFNLGALNDRLNEIVDRRVVQQQTITQVRYLTGAVVLSQKNIINEVDDQKMNEMSREIENLLEASHNELEKLKSLSSGELLSMAQQIESKLKDLEKVNGDIVRLTMQNTESIASDRSFNEAYSEFLKAKTTLEELINYLVASGTKDQINEASQIKETLVLLYAQEKNLLLFSNDTQQAKALMEASELENQLDLILTRLNRSTTGEARLLLDKYSNQFAVFYTNHKEIMKLALEKTNTKANYLSKNQAEKVSKDLAAIIEVYFNIVNKQLEADRFETDDMYDNAANQMIFIVILSFISSVLMAMWLLRGITGSLNIATEAVRKLSAGDFSVDVKINVQDEIGLMLKELQFMIEKLRNSVDVAKRVSKGDLMIDFSAQKSHGGELDEALEQMVNNLRDIAITIYNGADNVTAASQQVASASQQMSQGAQEQASAAEEVSSSMEQMAANILQNTDNSRETEKIANKALKDIQAGSQSVSHAVEAITTIADKIIIIEEIASKTDLLALNAAVEAARAGEHGKGFAVVAAEVRKLAERSQRAAAEINEISAQTVRQAKESKELLSNTLPDINKTAELVQEIAASSLEQNQGASQVNKAIQQLSQVTQGNASAAEEMSSNAEELNTQAEELKAAISYFKIDNRTSTRSTGKVAKDKQKYSDKDVQHAFSGNHKGFDLKLDNGPSDSEFTEF